MSIAFDHVILGARDLEAAARTLLADHGLASIPGGRHPGHGTGNRIVPLGADYLELMGVVDDVEAASSPMGRWVIAQLERGRHVMALSLRVDDVDAVARRIGSTVTALTRARPDGRTLRCRLTGLDAAFGPESLPFFIQWDVPDSEHPGADRAPHRARPLGIAWVELGGDAERLSRWIGPHDLDLRCVAGEPGPRACGIRAANGEIVLR